ncbi:GDSL esterase/lipase EXL1 isoform X5 [Lathyrus oleraceus]|uniref:GDSL esterase/lipase EXL1 isoform X5 n=1 Tax=Pisum sativum TaxID=3888 RepID=UPI0021D21361|nr:GDSL esterase/lipase EXL1-like isoform X5 [Pisum sativum]
MNSLSHSTSPLHKFLPLLLFRFIIILVVVSFKTKAVVKLPPNVSIPAVLVFGDSIMDTGNNNNNLRTTARCNFPPYGKDFEGGIPTGRFSNGKVPSDLIVEELGIKEYLPAYLDPNLQPCELLTGVNFASGGAGYDPMTSKLEDMYDLGARRIGVFNVPPMGCVPFQRTMAGGIERNCVEQYNDASVFFNNKLSLGIDSFNKNFPNSRVVYMDVYNPLLDIILNNQQYGYEVGNKGCCGTGTIEVTYLCNSLDVTCSNDLDYVFWDSFHPTESVYKKLVPPILQKYFHKFT